MTAPEEELQRLRLALYRPDPAPGTRERYEALRARLEPPQQRVATVPPPVRLEAAPPTPDPRPPDPTTRSRSRSRWQRAVAATAAVLVAAGAAVAVLAAQGGHASAARLAPALATGDGARLDRVLGPSDSPWGPTGGGRTVVDVLRRADLPQLRVWDRREAWGWLQRGSGPVHRDVTGGSARTAAEPISIVVRCRTEGAYRWTIRGTEPGREGVRVLAAGDADRCDRATVATATLAAGSRITAFDLRVPEGVGWTIAIVVPNR